MAKVKKPMRVRNLPAPMTPPDCDVSGIPFPDSLIDALAEMYGKSREEVLAAMPRPERTH